MDVVVKRKFPATGGVEPSIIQPVAQRYTTEPFLLLYNEELHVFNALPDIIRMIRSRRMKWARHVARMGEVRNAYKILVCKPERNRPLRRPRT
jgi:hypothetical protein